MSGGVILILFLVFAIVRWVISTVLKQAGKEGDQENDPSKLRPKFQPLDSPPAESDQDRVRRFVGETITQKQAGTETESEEERTRRFMEALGLPPGSVPPPKMTRPPAQQPAPRTLMTPVAPASIPRLFPSAPPPSPAPPAPWPQEPAAPLLGRQNPARESSPPSETKKPLSVGNAPPLSVPLYRLDLPFTKAPTTSSEPAPGEVLDALRMELRQRGALRKAFIVREIIGPPKALQSARPPAIFSQL